MSASQPSRSRLARAGDALRRRWPVALVVLVGSIATVWTTVSYHLDRRERSVERFRGDVARLAGNIEYRMSLYGSMLGAGAGLFDASAHVGREEWQRFVKALHLDTNYPGIQGVGYSEAMDRRDTREAFESRLGASRGELVRVRQVERRDDVHAIVYLEPEDARNRLAIGYDMHSEPIRRAAMDAAAESDSTRATAPVRLVQEGSGGAAQPGVLMLHPVYWRNEKPGTTSALRGFVYAAFRMHDLMNAMMREAPPDFAFSLRDGAADATAESMYRRVPWRDDPALRRPLTTSTGMVIGGRVWVLDASAPTSYGGEGDWINVAAIAGGGLLTTLLFALVVWANLRMRLQAEDLAGRITEDLNRSKQRFERMALGTSDGVWEYDVGSDAAYLSGRFMQLLGYEGTDRHETSAWIIGHLHVDDAAGAVEAFQVSLESRTPFEREMRLQRENGEYRWFRVRGRWYREGQRSYLAGAAADVHDERETRLSEARLLKVMSASPDLIMTFDMEGRPTYLNDSARKVFGAASDSLSAFSIAGNYPAWQVDRVFNEGIPTAYMQESWEGETELITADGQVLPVSQVILSHKGESGSVEFYSTVMRDISEQHAATEAMKEAQKRLQRALDGSNDVIWERHVASDEFYASERLNEILGYPPEMRFADRDAWMNLIHPEDRAGHVAAVKRMYESGQPQEWDTRMRCASGEWRWMRRRGCVVHDASGEAIMTAGTMTDIHEAKLAEHELKRHRDHLAELVEERTAGLERARVDAEASREAAERANLAKSEFLANMSHELRTPMHAIISFANFGVEKSARAERDKLLHYFGNIQKSGGRLLTLLNDLLDLSKLEAGKMLMNLAPCEPRALLEDVIGESEAFAGSRQIRFAIRIDEAVGTVQWDAPRMLQVLRNLVSNAVKFSPAGAVIELCASSAAIPAGRRTDDPIVPGVELRVVDSGVGIPEDELESVFDKFVQSSKTKTGAGGTGLGLAICREIVEAHCGTIFAMRNANGASGTTFVVRVPAEPGKVRLERTSVLKTLEPA